MQIDKLAKSTMDGLYFDGAMNKTTNGNGWGSVTDKHGLCMISSNISFATDITTLKVVLPNKQNRTVLVVKFNDVKSAQHNGAELVAMLIALRMATANPSLIKSIFGDSSLLIDYWSVGRVNKNTLEKMDASKRKMITECVTLRSQFEKGGGKIYQISGNDNPADLGFHR